MFKRKKPRFFFEGNELERLDEWAVPCYLSPEEDKSWKKLKQYLKENSLTVWCTFIGWNNFLERTILTGNIDDFINYLENFIKKFPSEMYLLTDSGDLNTAEIQEKREGRLY